MTPAEVIRTVRSDGITLTVADDGDLKMIGKADAVKRWLPAIREHKSQIIRVLSSDKTRVPVPLTQSEESAIRRWLALIGEDDPAMIAHCLEQCRIDLHKRVYYLGRSDPTRH